MPAAAQPRTRPVLTRLTPEEHKQLMYVCDLDGVNASELLRSGILIVIRRRLRYRGADKSRLAAIAIRNRRAQTATAQ